MESQEAWDQLQARLLAPPPDVASATPPDLAARNAAVIDAFNAEEGL